MRLNLTMPVLPLDHPEPFAATLGVMLYPGITDEDTRKARAFAVQYLAEPIRQFVDAGGQIEPDALLKLVTESGERLDDLDKRWQGGLWTGDIFKAYYILAYQAPELASLENATRIAEKAVVQAKVSGSRSSFKAATSRFRKVAHLWAAWSIREGRFTHDLKTGYTGWVDFQAFLTESEVLRDWGQTWRQQRAKAKPPLPEDVWRVPEDWRPPPQKKGWPLIGAVPMMDLPLEFIADLKPAVRR